MKIKKKYRTRMVLNAMVLMIFALKVSGVEVIKNPNPTHFEKNYKKLVKVNEIPEDFSDEHFLAKPTSYVVDDEGNIFIYDAKILKIFKFDKDCKFEKVFSQKGQGPSEIAGSWSGSHRSLYFSENGRLYFADGLKKKVMVFSKNGDCIEEFTVPGMSRSFAPVVDTGNNLYAMAGIDSQNLINRFNKEHQKTGEFLTRKDLEKVLFSIPGSPPTYPEAWRIPTSSNLFYDCIPGGGLVVYLRYASEICVFKDKNPVRRFYLWPKKGISNFKQYVKPESYPMIYNALFMDKDNQSQIYVGFIGIDHPLYCFTLDGKLEYIFVVGEKYRKQSLRFFAKRNNNFYGVSAGKIYLFKEEKQ